MSYKPAVYVYKIKHKTLQSPAVCWANMYSALNEIKMHLQEAAEGDKIEIEITKMNWEEFEQLPEYREVLK